MALKKHFTDVELDEEYGLIPVRGLTREEGLVVLDMQARRRLNMSGAVFLEKWRTDAFSDEFKNEHHSAFADLSILVAPFVRQELVEKRDKDVGTNPAFIEWELELPSIATRTLTHEEALAALDMQARERLNMSGEEFLRRWRADDFSEEFKDEHHSEHVVLMMMAAPFGR